MISDMPIPDTRVATWSTLPDREPAYALVAGVDLVIVRFDDKVAYKSLSLLMDDLKSE